VKKKIKKDDKKVIERLPRVYQYGEDSKLEWSLVKHSNPLELEWTSVRLEESRLSCYNWGKDGISLYCKGSLYGGITSKTKVKEFISTYLRAVKSLTSRIYSFIKQGDIGGFDNKSVQKTDIQFLFVRYVEVAWGGDVIDPAINAAFNTSRSVDPRFKYTLLEPVVGADDDESDEEDSGEGGVDEDMIEDEMGLDN